MVTFSIMVTLFTSQNASPNKSMKRGSLDYIHTEIKPDTARFVHMTRSGKKRHGRMAF